MTWEETLEELRGLHLKFNEIHSIKKIKDAPEHPGLKALRDRCVQLHYIRIQLNQDLSRASS
jgi:hypothetical protein